MAFRNLFVLCFLALVATFALTHGCKDMGSDISIPPAAPFVAAIIPPADTVEAEVKIEGGNFGGSQGNSSVFFGVVQATVFTRWREDEIKVIVPQGAITDSVKVIVGGRQSNLIFFEVLLPSGSFGVSQKNVSITVGDSAVQTISGGTTPYVIVSNSDTTKAAASITGNSLKIRGLAEGPSTVIIGDNSTPQLLDTISVTVSIAPLVISEANVNLVVGDSSVLAISGGTQPYVIVDQGNTSVATASILGNSLKIRAVGVGSTVVVVGDNSSPQLRDSVSVTVTVSTPISFANQIQPIFTASCVNQGCHPGGGAPFSLASGISYDNLVDVQQTNSSLCSSLSLRVQPNSAANSVLYGRISGTSCGSRMPLTGGNLTASQIDLIRDWINQGAQNN